MSETKVVVMKDRILGMTSYRMIKAEEVWAHNRVGMEPITDLISIEQAKALIKLLGE